MSTAGLRRCWHCGSWYKPEPRTAYHQRFCVQPECRAASKVESRRKWSRKNPGYFRGAYHVNRVRAWRESHPGYWKRQRARAAPGDGGALQDILESQSIDEQLVKVLRDRLSKEISVPLQDILIAQQHALVGITSMITGDALQDDIARVLTTCYERGQRIGGIVPWMKPQGGNDERARTDHAAAAAAHSPAVQLGGSPSGP